MGNKLRRFRRLIELLEPRQLLSAVSVSAASGQESSGVMTFHVALDVPAATDQTFRYCTRGITATPGKDYKPVAGRVTIPAGETAADITVPILDDAVWEPTQTFLLKLKAPHVKPVSAVGTITDDDLFPTVTIADAATDEGDAGRHFVTLGVHLSAAAEDEVDLRYASSDDSPYSNAATAGSDYIAVRGVVTFLPGETVKTIRVPIKGDRVVESNEVFHVGLTNRTYSGSNPLDKLEADVTIQDDDKPSPSDLPILSVFDTTEIYGPSETSVTVNLSYLSKKDVTFHYSYPAPASAGDGAAKSLQSSDTAGTLTIPAGQTSVSIPVTLTSDMAAQSNVISVQVDAVEGARPINNRESISAHVNFGQNGIPTLSTGLLSNLTMASGTLLSSSNLMIENTLINKSYPISTIAYVDPTLTSGQLYIGNIHNVIDTGGVFTGSTNIPITATINTGGGQLAVQGSTILVGSGTLRLSNPVNAGGTLAFNGTSSGIISLVGATYQLLPASMFAGSDGTWLLNSGPGSHNFTGTLNLPDGKAAVFYNLPVESLLSDLASAMDGGAWDGPGISSAVAATDTTHRTAVGYIVESDGSIRVQSALYGDANLDGVVDDADRAIVEQSIASGTSASWAAGDFNYDNVINADDLALADRNFGRTMPASPTTTGAAGVTLTFISNS